MEMVALVAMQVQLETLGVLAILVTQAIMEQVVPVERLVRLEIMV
jgi:hypothetical protein